MKEAIPLIRQHIVKAVAIGWFLGCLCVTLPLALALLITSTFTNLDTGVFLTQLLLLPPILAIQGLLIGFIVRVGLGLYQFITRRDREPELPADV